MRLGIILLIVGLVGVTDGWFTWYSGKPSPGERWWRNAAGGERIGGSLMMVTGAIFLIAGIVLVLIDLLS